MSFANILRERYLSTGMLKYSNMSQRKKCFFCFVYTICNLGCPGQFRIKSSCSNPHLCHHIPIQSLYKLKWWEQFHLKQINASNFANRKWEKILHHWKMKKLQFLHEEAFFYFAKLLQMAPMQIEISSLKMFQSAEFSVLFSENTMQVKAMTYLNSDQITY